MPHFNMGPLLMIGCIIYLSEISHARSVREVTGFTCEARAEAMGKAGQVKCHYPPGVGGDGVIITVLHKTSTSSSEPEFLLECEWLSDLLCTTKKYSDIKVEGSTIVIDIPAVTESTLGEYQCKYFGNKDEPSDPCEFLINGTVPSTTAPTDSKNDSSTNPLLSETEIVLIVAGVVAVGVVVTVVVVVVICCRRRSASTNGEAGGVSNGGVSGLRRHFEDLELQAATSARNQPAPRNPGGIVNSHQPPSLAHNSRGEITSESSESREDPQDVIPTGTVQEQREGFENPPSTDPPCPDEPHLASEHTAVWHNPYYEPAREVIEQVAEDLVHRKHQAEGKEGGAAATVVPRGSKDSGMKSQLRGPDTPNDQLPTSKNRDTRTGEEKQAKDQEEEGEDDDEKEKEARTALLGKEGEPEKDQNEEGEEDVDGEKEARMTLLSKKEEEESKEV